MLFAYSPLHKPHIIVLIKQVHFPSIRHAGISCTSAACLQAGGPPDIPHPADLIGHTILPDKTFRKQPAVPGKGGIHIHINFIIIQVISLLTKISLRVYDVGAFYIQR